VLELGVDSTIVVRHADLRVSVSRTAPVLIAPGRFALSRAAVVPYAARAVIPAAQRGRGTLSRPNAVQPKRAGGRRLLVLQDVTQAGIAAFEVMVPWSILRQRNEHQGTVAGA
jgi:hypothetical protein